MPRLVSAAFLTSALILGACAQSEPDDANQDSATTTEALVDSTTVPAESSTTSTTESTTTSTSTVELAAPAPSETLGLPPGFFLESGVLGERLVLFGADAKGGGGVFWAADLEFDTAVHIFDIVDPNLDPGSINQMVYFDGRYYGFPIWAEAENPLSPTMYVSSDGSTWEKAEFGSITKQASLRLTPDQPSSLGGAGVATAIVANGKIEATGWVTENETPIPVLWVGDGSSWVQTYLPTVEGASQGGYLASSQLGRLASLEGPTYFGAGTFVQMAGSSEWTPVDHAKDADGSEAFTRYLGASDSAFYHLEMTHTNERVMTTSTDGLTWTEVEIPDVLTDLPGLHVTADDRLVAYKRTFLADDEAEAVVWSLTDDGWVPTTYEGNSVVMVDDEHIVTADDTQLYVYDRDGQ